MMKSKTCLVKPGMAIRRQKLVKYLSSLILEGHSGKPFRVGIDGIDASGKTRLSNELADELKCSGRQTIRASVDGFHNPKELRYRRGRTSPEGYFHDSFDNQAIVNNILAPLGPKGALKIKTAIFDFRTDAVVDAPIITAKADTILIMEGVFLFRPELVDYWDLKIFLDVDFATSISRAVKRDQYCLGDEESIRKMYEERYIPGQMLYFSTSNPKERADIIIDNNDFQKPGLVLLSSKRL
ncbi:uridine kinase [Candidatus Micrarchaeota archaeon]|nr:uridine kinase [Candidatus Micrarchaeota archaeon]